MIANAGLARKCVGDLPLDKFLEETTFKCTARMALIDIGEASKNLYRSRPDLHDKFEDSCWEYLRKLRDNLAYNYGQPDYPRVWEDAKAITPRIPDLLAPLIDDIKQRLANGDDGYSQSYPVYRGLSLEYSGTAQSIFKLLTNPLFDLSCSFSHRAAVNSFKAFLSKNGVSYSDTTSIPLLHSISLNQDSSLECLSPCCQILSKYAPNVHQHIPPITQDECAEALKACDIIIKVLSGDRAARTEIKLL
jgi:uncharacterized protein with HEPN domain/HEPN domain-containing protein